MNQKKEAQKLAVSSKKRKTYSKKETQAKKTKKRSSDSLKRRPIKKNEQIQRKGPAVKRSKKNSAAVAAKRKRERERQQKKRRRQQLLLELGITAVIGIFLFLTSAAIGFSLPKVEGYSMIDTLNDKDRVFVNKLGTIKRFELIYFKEPRKKELSIRRVVGIPEDHLYYKNDKLYLNDTETTERFISDALVDAKQSGGMFTKDFSLEQLTGEFRVPKDKYFVLGDNRPFSTDSRNYGFVDKKDIVGVVEMRFFPLHDMKNF